MMTAVVSAAAVGGVVPVGVPCDASDGGVLAGGVPVAGAALAHAAPSPPLEPHCSLSCCIKGSLVRKRPKASSCPVCGTGTASGSTSSPAPAGAETAVALPPLSDGAAIGPLVDVVDAGAVGAALSAVGGCSIFIVRGTWNASRPRSNTPPTAA